MTMTGRDRTSKSRADTQHFSSEFHRLSQDLRTPLNAINGFAELLLMDEGLSAASADYARAILTAGGRLNQAVLTHLERAEPIEPRPLVLPRLKPEGEAQPAPKRVAFKYFRRLTAPRPYRAVKV
jgi:signal transduction histidine kinase